MKKLTYLICELIFNYKIYMNVFRMISIFSLPSKWVVEICHDYSFWSSTNRCTNDSRQKKTYPIQCDKSVECSRTHSKYNSNSKNNYNYCPHSSSLDQCQAKGNNHFFCIQSQTCIAKGD